MCLLPGHVLVPLRCPITKVPGPVQMGRGPWGHGAHGAHGVHGAHWTHLAHGTHGSTMCPAHLFSQFDEVKIVLFRWVLAVFTGQSSWTRPYIYIYICRESERKSKRCINTYIYMYIYKYRCPCPVWFRPGVKALKTTYSKPYETSKSKHDVSSQSPK